MPELPEVETIARDLRGLVTGSQIAGVRSNWAKTLRSHTSGDFAVAVTGRPIEGVGRRGKQLLVWLGPGGAAKRAADPQVRDEHSEPEARQVDRAEPASEVQPAILTVEPAATDPAVLTVHLKMTGQLFVVPAGTAQDRHVHLVLELADGRELRFRDMRKFGRIGLYRRDLATGLPVEGAATGVLAAGAEPLADEFTAARFASLLARRRGRLKTLLLNQDFLAGVGNIYADEALWQARLHPLRDAQTIRPVEARRLHGALRDVLAEAVERRGSSVDDYTAPEGDGSMQEHLAVYQRAGEPCLRCGREIGRIVVGGRSTHFCGWCQRLPATQQRIPAPALAPAGAGAGATAASGSRRAARRGPRWTELSGDGALGRTPAEEALAAEKAAERARRVAATRKAAATRRAAARAGGTA
jgi:formamidopyrimidine-DNA glycosylase